MIHLHIGRHKTGSTALQRFLATNRDALAARGFACLASPGSAAAHELANALNPKWLARATPAQREAAAAAERACVEQLARGGDKIASSEAFQNAPPQAVARVFPAGETRVVVYLREQLDYLLSAYAQMVQAQTTRQDFVTYARSLRRRTGYLDFLDQWAGVFGREQILARVYARDALEGGDIGRDFLAALGVGSEGLRFPKLAANPSIGPELIEAKGLINAYVPPDVQKQVNLYPLLGRLTEAMPGRLRVTAGFADRVRGVFAASNAALFERYFADESTAFPPADLTGPAAAVDRTAALERTLGLLAEMSPEAAAAIGQHMPARPDLDRFAPLLPQDWDAAAETLETLDRRPA